jgi:hypothetical protein
MKIFLGWSGDKSRQIADTFHNWIKAILQYTEPFISTRDIDKGSAWQNVISDKLKDCIYGIFFITAENMNNPWIHFEAGAIAKEIGQNKVCPILFDINQSELKGPLTIFQSTRLEKDDMLLLVKNINEAEQKHRLSDEVLIDCFEAFWPKFDQKIRSLGATYSIKAREQDKVVNSLSIEELKGILLDLFKEKSIQEAGLKEVYRDRVHSLVDMRDEIELESKQIVIIGSSLKGLIGIGGDSTGNTNLIRIALIEAIKRKVKIHIILTNPEIAHHRSKQEGRESGEIEREIIENIIYLVKEKKELNQTGTNLEIKLYNGTPTIFMLATSKEMFFNPYTLYSKAYESICFRLDSKSLIYDNYMQNQYSAAWGEKNITTLIENDNEKAIKQIEKIINGKNQHGAQIVPDEGIRNYLLEKLSDFNSVKK